MEVDDSGGHGWVIFLTPIGDGRSLHKGHSRAQSDSLECGRMSAHEEGGAGGSEEEVVRRRLTEAEQRYREEIRAYSALIGSGSGEAIAEAARKKDAARNEFHRLLKDFSDLVIRGKRRPPKS